MAYVPVSRTIAKRFGGEANLRMAVSKAVSGGLAVLFMSVCPLSVCYSSSFTVFAHSSASCWFVDIFIITVRFES